MIQNQINNQISKNMKICKLNGINLVLNKN